MATTDRPATGAEAGVSSGASATGAAAPAGAAASGTAPVAGGLRPELRPLFTATVHVGAPLEVGEAPHGRRRIIPIEGGTFSGERLSGRVVPGGADWQIIRPDGVAEIEALYTLETDDGALIYVRNPGIRTAPPEVMDRLVRGEVCDPSEYYFRTCPVFETGAPAYQWLHRLVAICAGERYPDRVVLSFYEVT